MKNTRGYFFYKNFNFLYRLYLLYVKHKTFLPKKTYSIKKCIDQINFIKKVSNSLYIGGGVSEKNARDIINIARPNGLDVSRSLKGKTRSLSNVKLKKFLNQVTTA